MNIINLLLYRYYKDSSKRPDLSKAIMLVGINNGYRDFFHNFKCYMDRLGTMVFIYKSSHLN